MHFWKYHGAGNDFILLDQRERQWVRRDDTEKVARLCDRHFGIGANGLILLMAHPEYDFEMVYFNADGREGSMCGNGGRCIVAFAYRRGIQKTHYRFWAVDGLHEAELTPTQSPQDFWVALHMRDVQSIQPWTGTTAEEGQAFVLDTGSPHYVQWVNDLDRKDMVQEGRAVRYSEPFRAEGINVNFVEPSPEGICIRTYERGVEDETLACGTGVTAAALAWHVRQGLASGAYEFPVLTRGGELRVRFTASPQGGYTDIWLCGPATEVFSGEIPLH
ncbi:MAG: diaminopimelate epimerase [Saprospiraceae bacterium]|nr:diaminopimelate epimerase [Saprospiraceae bacterium]MDW8230062.1 diaminopimelate epimerase [Saprospiraceae bacterium]